MSGWIGAWGTTATVTNLIVTGSEIISVNTSTDALRITQAGTGNALVVEDSANPDSTPFIVDSTGAVGIGTTPTSGANALVINAALSAATSLLVNTAATANAGVTTCRAINATASAGAGAAVTTLSYYRCAQGTFTGTVTDQYGFIAEANLIGATGNNFGFYAGIPSGAGRYNFYANGTADNYFAGNTYTASGTTSMTNGFFYIPAADGAPSGVPTAVAGRVPMYYDTTNNNFYIYNGAWKKVLLA